MALLVSLSTRSTTCEPVGVAGLLRGGWVTHPDTTGATSPQPQVTSIWVADLIVVLLPPD